MNALSLFAAAFFGSFLSANTPLDVQEAKPSQKADSTKAKTNPAAQENAEKLTLKHAVFAKTGINDSVMYIMKLALKADEKEQRGVNILLHIGNAKVPDITMEIRDVSVWDAVQAVAKATGLRVSIIGEIILLHTESTAPRERKVPGLADSALWKALRGINVELTQFVRVPVEDVLDHIRYHASEAGITLNMVYPTVETPPVTLNTRKAALTDLLEATAELTGQEITATGDILVLRKPIDLAKKRQAKAKAEPGWMKSDVWNRAGGIVYDDIAFVDAAVSEVAEHLAKESKANDKSGKGVNVTITGMESQVLTLVLLKAKLSDIVLALAESRGLEISVDERVSWFRVNVRKPGER